MEEDAQEIKRKLALALSNQKTINQLSSSGENAQKHRAENRRAREAKEEKEKQQSSQKDLSQQK